MTKRESIRTPGKPPPWDDGTAGERASFGSWLRRQREVREITLREIADSTKISLRYLEAFERDELEALPAPVFARGFLRQYAAYVGLDPDEAVNSFIQATADEERAREEEIEEAGPARRQSGSWAGRGWLWAVLSLLFLVAAAVALAFAFWPKAKGVDSGAAPARLTEPAREAQSEAPAAVPAAVSGSAAGDPRPEPPTAALSSIGDSGTQTVGDGAPLRVTLEFSEECWVELDVDSGVRYVSELHVQGESLRIEARESVRILTLGNPEGVRLEVNGEPFTLPPVPAGSVLHDVEILGPPTREPEGSPSGAAGTQ